jgi:hypothetical protein
MKVRPLLLLLAVGAVTAAPEAAFAKQRTKTQAVQHAIHIDRVAPLSAGGRSATLTGKLKCSPDERFMLSGRIAQQVGERSIEVDYYSRLSCQGTTTHWSLEIAQDEYPPDLYGGPFAPGRATATVRLYPVSQALQEPETVSAPVTLRRH